MSAEQRRAASFWRAAGIIVSFIPWISVAVTSCRLSDKDGCQWDPTLGPVSGWLEPHGEARLYWSKSTTGAPSFDDARPAIPWLLPHLIDTEVRSALLAAAGNPLFTLGAVLLRMPVTSGLGHNLQTIYERSITFAMDVAKRGDRDDLGSQPMALSPVCVAAIRDAAKSDLAVMVAGGAGLRWPQSLDMLTRHLQDRGLNYQSEYEVLSLLQDLNLINSMDAVDTDKGRLLLLRDALIAFPLAELGSASQAEPLAKEGGDAARSSDESGPGDDRAGEGGAADKDDGGMHPDDDPLIDELFSGAFTRLAADVRSDYSQHKGALSGEKGSAEHVWVPAVALESYGVPIKQFQAWLLKNDWITPEEGDATKARIPHSIDGKKQPCLRFNAAKLRDFYKRTNAGSES